MAAGHFPPGLPRGAADRRLGRLYGAGRQQRNSGAPRVPRAPNAPQLGFSRLRNA